MKFSRRLPGIPCLKNEERPEILQHVGSSYAISFKKHVAYTGLPKSPDLYFQRAFAVGFRGDNCTKLPSTEKTQFRTKKTMGIQGAHPRNATGNTLRK